MEPRLRFNLDELLKRNNLRASDLSKLTGIPKQTLSEWRSGLVPKSVLALKRVAATLGVSLDELVFMNPPNPSLQADNAATSMESNDCLLAVDHSGRLAFPSSPWTQLLAWDANWLAQRPLVESICIDDQEEAYEQMMRPVAPSATPVFQCRVLRASMAVSRLSFTRVPLRGEQQRVWIAQHQRDEGYDEPQAFDAVAWLQVIAHNFRLQNVGDDCQVRLEMAQTGWTLTHRRFALSQLVQVVLADLRRQQSHRRPTRIDLELENKPAGCTLRLHLREASEPGAAAPFSALPQALLQRVQARFERQLIDSTLSFTLSWPHAVMPHPH